MQHNAVVAATIGLALSFAGLISEDAMARPRRYADGHPVICGRGSIPVRVYAADHYSPRPSVCGGGPVNANMEPDFQLVRTR